MTKRKWSIRRKICGVGRQALWIPLQALFVVINCFLNTLQYWVKTLLDTSHYLKRKGRKEDVEARNRSYSIVRWKPSTWLKVKHYTVNGTWEKNNILYTYWFTLREIFHLPRYRGSCRRRSSKGGNKINISLPHGDFFKPYRILHCQQPTPPLLSFSFGFHGDCVCTCIMQNINWQWHPP